MGRKIGVSVSEMQVLRNDYGMTNAEIAESLDISPATVQKYIGGNGHKKRATPVGYYGSYAQSGGISRPAAPVQDGFKCETAWYSGDFISFKLDAPKGKIAFYRNGMILGGLLSLDEAEKIVAEMQSTVQKAQKEVKRRNVE